MSRRLDDNTVGPWARDKLDSLGQYLDFFTKVLKNQRDWCKGTIYVDAFAGSGQSRVRTKSTDPMGGLLADLGVEKDVEVDADAAEFIAGSPRRALEITNPFDQYVFIERDPARIAELEKLKVEFGYPHRIDIRAGDAKTEIEGLLQGNLGRPGYKAVVFLDPFGMQVPWSTIERLGATRNVEVVINFALGMAIQRLLVRSGDIPTGWRSALDTYFGSPDWYVQTYDQVDDLLGRRVVKFVNAGSRLLNWYRERLKASFGRVSPARLIRNTKGGHLYYLVWAGTHSKGLEGARYILSRGDKV
jgi:three-Cys-motif partner protein